MEDTLLKDMFTNADKSYEIINHTQQLHFPCLGNILLDYKFEASLGLMTFKASKTTGYL